MDSTQFFVNKGPFPLKRIVEIINSTTDLSKIENLKISGFKSLTEANENDMTFGNDNSSLKTLNYLGVYGAHIAGFLIVVLHYSSYLIPIFFLIIGIKSIFGIKYKNF